MNNILKQFAVWATSLKQSKFERAAIRLTFTYVLSIFLILLISSVAILVLTIEVYPESYLENDYSKNEGGMIPDAISLYEFHEHLIFILVIVDISILFITSIGAYLFARRTLRPIEILYQQQERFVGDVAHELRTPLAVLKAGLELILIKERTSQEYIIFIKESEEEIDRLIRLSNDLLFLLKQQNHRKELFVKVNLVELVEQQVKQFQPYAVQKNITITCSSEGPVFVEGVADSLIRLCQNLIKNAVDYNIPSGMVAVSIVTEKEMAVLTIKDSGIGIEVEEQKNIFERFYKIDTARTQVFQSGTGLGLAIVKNIVKIHRGQVILKSAPNQGTTVIVKIPNLT